MFLIKLQENIKIVLALISQDKMLYIDIIIYLQQIYI